MTNQPEDLARIYERRFAETHRYRHRVWSVLTREFFQQWIAPGATVLDLGSGYGEFINQITAAKKYGLDLNPQSKTHLDSDVEFLCRPSDAPWPLPDNSLDTVFTSNFFEHLPHKDALGRTLDEVRRCLKPGGLIIAMGPNIKYLPGQYWDFWDHHLPLTELSLGEALETRGFSLRRREGKFMPYTMVGGPEYPLVFVSLYLKLALAWRFFGRQFLVVGEKPARPPEASAA